MDYCILILLWFHCISLPECHEIKERDGKILESYLEKIAVEPEILCYRLELSNCNKLKYSDELKPFYMARSYLSHRSKACWESLVNIFCEIKECRLANEIARNHNMHDKQHCNCKTS